MNESVIEILTEEQSMENFLRVLLPRILPEDYKLDENCLIRPHEGKSDLQKSIPRKMRAYPRFPYPVKVLIVHDQDSNDCAVLKEQLAALCSPETPAVIRIACRELENWYLGDLNAVEAVYPGSRASSLAGKARYRNPDAVFGTAELERMTQEFTKSVASREIPKHMDIQNNNSPSFKQFISGLEKLIAM